MIIYGSRLALTSARCCRTLLSIAGSYAWCIVCLPMRAWLWSPALRSVVSSHIPMTCLQGNPKRSKADAALLLQRPGSSTAPYGTESGKGRE